MIFKRKDTGDVAADKWFIAEYYKSLGHLSPEGFEKLTERLKETCTFFPTIKECLDIIRPASRYDWGHPFLDAPKMFRISAPEPARQIATQPAMALIEGPRDDG